ncbi:MAG: ABC transporter ATP-binding protein, partial [Pararhodobacter sp.]|nr:ABC transporter ATP-binding protein [Pararhodobacter sp.]
MAPQDIPPAPTALPLAQRRAHDRALTGWLWTHYVRRWTPYILLGMVLMAVDGAMVGAVSTLLKPMFDDVLVAGQSNRVIFVALAISGTFVIRGVTSLLYRVLMSYVAQKVVTSLQLQLTDHLMRLDQSFHHEHSPGHLIDRIRGDTQELTIIFDKIIPGFGRDMIAIIALIGVALYTDVQWTLIALIGVPFLVLPAAIMQRLVRRMGVATRDSSALASTRLDEIF